MADVVSVYPTHIKYECKDLADWCSRSNHVYIGNKRMTFINKKRYPKEDSIWANPFKTGRDGTREQVLEKYRDYIIKKVERNELDLNQLQGKVLGCWCKPNKCHGDILNELLTKKV